VDESNFRPSFLAIFLSEFWAKYFWGYVLGPLLGIKKRTVKNLKKLPFEARSHKEVVLRYYGLRHALKPASEAGIDLTNAPGTFVSLLPDEPEKVASDISAKISKKLGKRVIVIIIDTDATYEIFGKLFTSLPIATSGIMANFGFFGYLLGRFGKIKGPTPLGISKYCNIHTTIEISKIAHDFQEENEKNMATIYEMKDIFQEEIDGITVEMLSSIEHMPAVIVRRL
jgi:F420-0:gamma-glutamyl ligase-like protein